jgi:vancomycin resistance protein YoaR
MRTYPLSQQKNSALADAFLQVSSAILGGLAIFLFLSLASYSGFSVLHVGKIYPGVSVGGVPVGDLSVDEAATMLKAYASFPETGKIVFQDGDQVWVARPSELGLNLDAAASAQAAYQWGRTGGAFNKLGNRFQAWQSGHNLAPVMTYDERQAQAYLEQLAAKINRPTIEAALSANGLEVVVLPGQVGRTVNTAANLAALHNLLPNLTDGLVTLEIEEASPAILDASQQAEIARRILSAPLTLQMPPGHESELGPWSIPPEQLAEMLVIERIESAEGARYQVALDGKTLSGYLERLAPQINRVNRDARFIFNDETRLLEVIQPSVTGRSLDIPLTVQEINRRLLEGQHSVPLTVHTNQPQVSDDATGEQLGIREQVVSYTSYFRGSTAERLQNIKIASENFHGLLVPPGAVFSMANTMGSVTLDDGYAEAWIIYGGRTIKGVGGGVCQVSTTLFRAAFFAGFPIVERYAHAYRVSYYEQTRTGIDPNLAGLDATVFVPMVDFKFQNDTPYWLLMETYFNPTARSLTWKFYSTSDGRKVEWSTTGLQQIVEAPDPIYEENPDLGRGVIKQVDWAADGADVVVTRKVLRNGVLLFEDLFRTHYMPWADVFQYGPGTELPTDIQKRNR